MPSPSPKPQKPGTRTTELWGKVVIQVVLIINALFGIGIEIDDELALGIAGLMESSYAISRGIAKRQAPALAVEIEELAAAVAKVINAQKDANR